MESDKQIPPLPEGKASQHAAHKLTNKLQSANLSTAFPHVVESKLCVCVCVCVNKLDHKNNTARAEVKYSHRNCLSCSGRMGRSQGQTFLVLSV